MATPFVRKLEYGAHLTDDDRRTLEDACRITCNVRGRTQLIGEGDAPSNVHLIQEGFACRYKLLPSGKRQIMAIFIPGDICDLHVQILGEMDHCIGTLTDAVVVELPPDIVEDLTTNPRINRALWWATLVDEGTLREWLVSMGQRPAEQQMAHIFCELLTRLQAIGLGVGNSFEMPFTQEELADTLGVTSVHANRVLMQLRHRDLILTEGRRLVVPDFRRLKDFCDFEPNYLHLKDGTKRATDRAAGKATV